MLTFVGIFEMLLEDSHQESRLKEPKTLRTNIKKCYDDEFSVQSKERNRVCS